MEKKKNEFSRLRNKNKNYRITTTKLITLYDYAEKETILINLNIRFNAKFHKINYGYNYRITSFDEEFIEESIRIIAEKNEKYKELIEINKEDIMENAKCIRLSKNQVNIKVENDSNEECKVKENKWFIYNYLYYGNGYNDYMAYRNYCIEELIGNDDNIEIELKREMTNTTSKKESLQVYENIEFMYGERTKIAVISEKNNSRLGLNEFKSSLCNYYIMNFKITDEYDEFIKEGNKLETVKTINLKNGIKLNNIRYLGRVHKIDKMVYLSRASRCIYKTEIEGIGGEYIIYSIKELFSYLKLKITNVKNYTRANIEGINGDYYLCEDKNIKLRNKEVFLTKCKEKSFNVGIDMEENEELKLGLLEIDFNKNKELAFDLKENLYLVRDKYGVMLVEKSNEIYEKLSRIVKKKEKMRLYGNINESTGEHLYLSVILHCGCLKFIQPTKKSIKNKDIIITDKFLDQINKMNIKIMEINLKISSFQDEIKDMKELKKIIKYSIVDIFGLDSYSIINNKMLVNSNEYSCEVITRNKIIEDIELILLQNSLTIDELIIEVIKEIKDEFIKYDKHFKIKPGEGQVSELIKIVNLFTLGIAEDGKKDEYYKDYIREILDNWKVQTLLNKI